MSAGKHTPGPWKVRENGGLMKAVEDNKDWLVYACGRDYMGREELEANARLIAAAPDLLDALIDCRRALEIADFTGELAVVNAAIAKATGESK